MSTNIAAEVATAAAPAPTGPTGPRTTEGKSRTRLNAFRHGLTGHLFLLSPEETPRFREHHKGVTKHYQPLGPVEEALVLQVATGMWRLHRCFAMEEAMFAMDAAEPPADLSQSQVFDHIIGPAKTWIEKGKSVALLSTYEGRIRRALDKDKAELEAVQARRKEEAAQAMTTAKALYKLAKAEGKPYQPELYFTRDPQSPEFVFSADKVAGDLARQEAMAAADSRLRRLQIH